MQDQRTPDLKQHDAQVEQAILMLLLDKDEQRPWSIRELELEIGDRLATEDSLGRLQGAGLVHRCGEFAWATRAALRADELAG